VLGGEADLRAEPLAIGARKSSRRPGSLAVWSEATEIIGKAFQAWSRLNKDGSLVFCEIYSSISNKINNLQRKSLVTWEQQL
jgi:hypothetical protein